MTGDGAKVPHAGSPEGLHRAWKQGVAAERARIVAIVEHFATPDRLAEVSSTALAILRLVRADRRD